MMADDLTTMSKKQLEKLLSDVKKAMAEIEAKEKKEAKIAAEKAAAKYGFSLADLTDGPRGRGGRGKSAPKNPGVPKYANPEDPSETWTGKGRQPQWFKESMEAGKDPKDLEI